MSDETKFREAQQVIKTAIASLSSNHTPAEAMFAFTTVFVGMQCALRLKENADVYESIEKGCLNRLVKSVESFIIDEIAALEKKATSRN